MAALTTTIAAGVTAATAIYGAVKADEARADQKKQIKEEQDIQKKEIATQKEEALKKRKEAIDLQRRQLLGSGDSGKYAVAGYRPTTINSENTLTGVVLG